MTEPIAATVAVISIALLLVAFVTLASGRPRIAVPLAVLAFAALSFATIWRTYLSARLDELGHAIATRDTTISGLERDLAQQRQARAVATAALRKAASLWTSSLAALSKRLESIDIVAQQPPRLETATDIERHVSDLSQLMSDVAHPPLRALPRQVFDKVALLLEASIRSIVKRERYSIEARSQTELVLGRLGTYYVIRPLDPTTGEPFVFSERLHELGDSADRFRAAIDDIHNQVLAGLGRVVEHEIYTIGNADAPAFELEWPDVARELPPLMVLKRPAADKPYQPTVVPHTFGTKLTNDDLPNLRAHRLASALVDKTGERPVAVLDNKPHHTADAKLRTAEIILFLSW